MTQKEIDLQMQKLKMQYAKRRNEIARQKDDVNRDKMAALLQADDAFHSERRVRISKINLIRAEKAALFEGDPKKAVLEAEARKIESEIALMRADNEQRKRTIVNEAYANRRALDEQSRQLSEWYEDFKLAILENADKDIEFEFK